MFRVLHMYIYTFIDIILMQVWDGVSNRCISTFQTAHSGQMVCVHMYIHTWII